jgi:ParB family chromosome partitioning protein
MTPMEEARAFKMYVSKSGWGGASELAQKLGKSVSYVTKRIALLDLPQTIIDAISKSTISPSIAEELYSISDDSKKSQLAELVSKRHLSLRKVREMIKDFDAHDDYFYGSICNKNSNTNSNNDRYEEVRKAQRLIDKSIIAVKIALSKVGAIMEEAEDDWPLSEILMQHKNMLHDQIDILLKEKRNYRNMFRINILCE